MDFEVFKEPRMIFLVVINAPIYYLYLKIIFDDIPGFIDSASQAGQLDVVSYFQGTLLDDWWHTAKILIFLFFCYKTVTWEYEYFFLTS